METLSLIVNIISLVIFLLAMHFKTQELESFLARDTKTFKELIADTEKRAIERSEKIMEQIKK